MANKATDSHTHKGVVSLVMLIAHAVTRRIAGSAGFPRLDDNGAIRGSKRKEMKARVRMTHVCRVRPPLDAEVR